MDEREEMDKKINKDCILITGVAGLIGSNLADWIIKNKPEYRVIGIDNLEGGYQNNIHEKVIFYKKDIVKDNLSHLFKDHNVKKVFHFAAYAAEGLSPFIRKFNYNNNLVGTAEIINQCIENDVERLIFTSSMAVYGNNNPPFSENDIPKPIDPYGIAKYGCEMDLSVAYEQHGLEYCIIRPHNVYGEKQNIWDKYRNVLGIWMYQYMRGDSFTIFGDGEQKRAFTYIGDILEPLWNAAFSNGSKNEIINLGGIKKYTINESANILSSILEGSKKRFLEKRHEVKEAFTTYKKSEELLGFEHKTDLKEGLIKMWDWAKEQPYREQQKWDSYEIEKGVYNFWK